MSKRTILEQGRAAYAYEAAIRGKSLKGKPLKNKEGADKSSEYKAYVKKMPMYIKTNGLGAAMSFAFAKGKGDSEHNAWGLIYHQITTWLGEKDEKHLIEIEDGNLMKALINTDSSTYRATTIEVLALLNWMRRFAEGLITKED